MSLEEAIVNQFRNYPPLAALVGTRIYPVTYPQSAVLPVVVYQRTSRLPEYSHDGDCGAAESRFQISTFAKSYSTARQTADAIKGALTPWEEQQAISGDVRIGGVFMEDEIDLYNPADVETESDYQILGDWRFLYGGL